MKKTRGFLLAAGVSFAMVFTLSCSGDGSDGGNSVTYKGQKYKTPKISEQVWFAENLNYAGDDNSIGKCYDNDPVNCAKYGRLYTWSEAIAVCTDGWRLPSKADWDVLINYAGGSHTAGTKLKATSGWENKGNGTDYYGFSALPGGGGNSRGNFGEAGFIGIWWGASEDEYDRDDAYILQMFYFGEDSEVGEYTEWGYSDKSNLFSVRCLKD